MLAELVLTDSVMISHGCDHANALPVLDSKQVFDWSRRLVFIRILGFRQICIHMIDCNRRQEPSHTFAI